MSRPDPARDTIARARADAQERANVATNAIVRFLVGGCGWRDDRVARARLDLARAVAEIDALDRASVMLDQLDREMAS